MKKVSLGIIGLGLVFSLSGCVGTSPAPQMKPLKNSNEMIEVAITPSGWGNCSDYEGSWSFRDDFNSLSISVKNKTEKSVEIDWNKSSYVVGNKTFGKFMITGNQYKTRMDSKTPSVIFPKDNFSTSMTPVQNVYFVSNRFETTWKTNCLGDGYEMNLVYKVGDKEHYMKVRR